MIFEGLVSSPSRCSACPPQSKILIRACLQTTTEHTTENRETGDSTPYLHAGYWRRRAGDGGGAEGDDALVSPVTGSASPSPVLCARALLPRQLVAWFVRVSCVPGLRALCWLALDDDGQASDLLTWWKLEILKLGWAAGPQVKWATIGS